MAPYEEQLNRLLVDTFNEILKVEERVLKEEARGVTIHEVHTLHAIGVGEPRTITELADACLVTVSTMTIGVTRLQVKGLVEKVRDATDKRIVRVRLTEKGESIVAVHAHFHRRMVEAVLDHLDEAHTQALIPALENLQGFFRREAARFPLKEDSPMSGLVDRIVSTVRGSGDGHSSADANTAVSAEAAAADAAASVPSSSQGSSTHP